MVRQELTGRGIGGWVPRVCPPRFVGRERELVVLAEAVTGPPAVVLVALAVLPELTDRIIPSRGNGARGWAARRR